MVEQLKFYIPALLVVAFSIAMITRARSLVAAVFFSLSAFFIGTLLVMLSCYLEASMVVLLIAIGIACLFVYLVVKLNVVEEQRRFVSFFSIAASVAVMCMSVVIILAISKPPYVELPAVGQNFTSGTSLIRSLFGQSFFEAEGAALMILISLLGAAYLISKKQTVKDEEVL